MEAGVINCTKCGIPQEASHFNRNSIGRNGLRAWCKTCLHNYYVANKRKLREQHVLREFGIPLEVAEKARHNQEGRCKICKKEVPLNIDHCHTTGIFRGLLCSNCNNGLGHFKDSEILLYTAIAYLRGEL
jgi:hypothetical protein